MKSNASQIAIAVIQFACGLGAGVSVAAEVDYARDVRPILSDACFHCHGPDENTREADLRLDTQDGLSTELGDRAVVVPNDPLASELYRRITADDSDIRMPPAEANKSLSDDDREMIRKWISQGAQWQNHWSFEQPTRRPPPQARQNSEHGEATSRGKHSKATNWGKTAIDAFILEKLKVSGLEPNETAQPHALVRRLYLDLIGVIPSPAESDTWVSRIWPDGEVIDEHQYQSLVSSLLSSPRYGERWARKWLDLARYADTNGYEKDRDRTIWPYRDWVIDAINADMPFDQFTIEQLAGDMLPNATESQIVATGFHRNTMLNEEGGIDPLEFRYHAMTDRVATTGTTWLGLTLGCCQCHTHKYDPISHTEYFGIMALMNNTDEPQFEVTAPSSMELWQRNKQQAREILNEMRQNWKPADKQPENADNAEAPAPAPATSLDEEQRQSLLDAALTEWLANERVGLADWRPARPISAKANLPILTIEDDGSIFASGDTAKRDDYWIEYEANQAPVYAIRLEALADERLPAGGPGSTYYEGTLGDFYLTEFRLLVGDRQIPITSAAASYEKNRYGSNPATAALSIDGDIQTGWSVHDAQSQDHVAVYKLAEPIPPGTPFRVHMSFGRHFASSLGRFRISTANEEARNALPRTYSQEVARLIAAESPLTPEQHELLVDEFLLAEKQFETEAAKVRKLRLRPRLTTTLVMRERPVDQPRPTFRHHRGEYLQPREPVSPGLPTVLTATANNAPSNAQPAPSASNRLEFARWLVSKDNPLTARVTVNRHWAALMGRGIVKTVDDFGLQGTPPTHPELLDWLAVEFMDTDHWSIKALHRRIVSSAVYRQSSVANQQALPIDPENTLYWRSSRPRLEAEVIRDSILAASGVLVHSLGGPPVRPPQPAGVTEVAYGSPKWSPSSGASRFRRSIYTKVKRTAPFAMFATFDAPSGEACVARRSESNSPLQALTLLNDPMIAELTLLLAKNTLENTEITTDSLAAASPDQVADVAEAVFRRILVRPPSESERTQIADFLQRQLAPPQGSAKEDPTREKPRDDAARTQQAVASLARALIALDETQTRN